MRRSTERILTTHVGSLVRPPDVLEGILTKVAGKPVDEAAFQAKVRKGVAEDVRKQAEVGIDIPSDGEFVEAELHRLRHRAPGRSRSRPTAEAAKPPMNYPILNEEFPGFMAQYNAMYRTMWMPRLDPARLVDAAIERTPGASASDRRRQDHATRARRVKRDLDRLQGGARGPPVRGGVRPVRDARRATTRTRTASIRPSKRTCTPSPTRCTRSTRRSSTPASSSSSTSACPRATRCCPASPTPTWDELRRASEMQVEAYNHALQGIPEDRVRYHLCWGSMNTPHTSDIPLKDIVDLILKINAQATRSRPPIRATSTSGWSGRTSSCRTARS